MHRYLIGFLVGLLSYGYLDLLREEQRRRNAIVADMFEAQLQPYYDKSDHIGLICGRRSGKTEFCMRECLDDTKGHQNADYAYLALTRASARDIVWERILKPLNERYQLGAKFNEQLLQMRVNGCRITLYGLDRPGWEKKFRGNHYRRVIIDECGEMTMNLGPFVDEIVEPTLLDDEGTLYCIGTPGRIPNGFWWDLTRPEKEKRLKGWSVYEWNVLQNPHMKKKFLKFLARKKLNNPDIEHSPSFVREWLGRWVFDVSDNIYQYNQHINLTDDILLDPASDRYVLGVDFGYHDASSFVVGCWSPKRSVWLVLEAFKAAEMDVTDVASKIKEYMLRFPGLRIVGDYQRAQLVAELRKRHSIPIVKADKTEKKDWVRVINADLQAGVIKLVDGRTDQLAEEFKTLKKKRLASGDWDFNHQQSDDCADAHLYAYKHGLHWRTHPEQERPKRFSVEYFKRMEDDMFEESAKQARRGRRWR